MAEKMDREAAATYYREIRGIYKKMAVAGVTREVARKITLRAVREAGLLVGPFKRALTQ